MKSEGIAPLRAVPSLYACVPAENGWTIALESTRSQSRYPPMVTAWRWGRYVAVSAVCFIAFDIHPGCIASIL